LHWDLADSWLAPQLPRLLPHSSQWPLQGSPDAYQSPPNTQTHTQCTIVLIGKSTHHLTHTARADAVKQIRYFLQLLAELLGLFSLSKSKQQKESIINHYSTYRLHNQLQIPFPATQQRQHMFALASCILFVLGEVEDASCS